jgi:hypothetical protein
MRAAVPEGRRVPLVAPGAALELGEHHRRRRARTSILLVTPCRRMSSPSKFPFLARRRGAGVLPGRRPRTIRGSERSRLFDAVRGAIALYISITGVVFALLLSALQEELDTHIAWVDFTVHKLVPIVFVIDWLIDPPRHRFPVRLGFAWLGYPLSWFAYTLIRGASEDW